MPLYIVVRHPKNKHPNWQRNIWLDDDRLLSITTTPEVAEQCRTPDTVYIHRCAYRPEGGGYIPPLICCSAKVASTTGPADQPVITFKELKVIGTPVQRRLHGPTNSYTAREP